MARSQPLAASRMALSTTVAGAALACPSGVGFAPGIRLVLVVHTTLPSGLKQIGTFAGQIAANAVSASTKLERTTAVPRRTFSKLRRRVTSRRDSAHVAW